MNICEDVFSNRSALLGARIRFSPSGACIRHQAIGHIIEQHLASIVTAEGLTEKQLQDVVTGNCQLSILRSSDIRHGINSLQKTGSVIEVGKGKKRKNRTYVLSESRRAEITQTISESENTIRRIVIDLFGNSSEEYESYRRAFLSVLCVVFSRLSETYVQIIAMNPDSAHLSGNKLLFSAIDEVLKTEHVPNTDTFRYEINRFFKESTPDFNSIKWNMTQNYYVLKALGIDSSSDLLSSDVFEGSSLYCDTNVLIAGLTPESRHHASFKEMAKACSNINMTLKVAHATVEELKGVVYLHASLLKEVFDKIPDGTQAKVRSFLLEAFLSEQHNTPDLTIEDFIERFQQPLGKLRRLFDLTEVDDIWFDTIKDEKETNTIAKNLAQKYRDMRGRLKNEKASLHDAILLRWVSKESTDSQKSWAVTLDTTLADWNAETKASNVITLDAFLQWMSPISFGAADEDRLAEIFSEAIRYQLLPLENFFSLNDFQIFAEMGIETKNLPNEDVEACIREIKTNLTYLDPAKAEDRERMGQVIQRYFVDPGTKYKHTIEELRLSVKKLSQGLAEEEQRRENAERRAGELELTTKDMSSQIEKDKSAFSESKLQIEKLEANMEEREKAAQAERLRISVVWRSMITLCLLIVVEMIIGYLCWQYGEGKNFFQKLVNAWQFPLAGFSFVAVIYGFLMGRKRMRFLMWWKGEVDSPETNTGQ